MFMRDVSRKELISSDVILSEVRTSIRFSQADPYLLPVPGISNVIPKPLRKPVQPVLPVSPTRNAVASVGPRDSKSKYKHNK
ncbi:hypothetical protein RchiOBHm_Chr2g0093111 [Rosa chinensis]|uniref:Uncharacterized protein n=1 Tax=Rosa chinensis TaxID=74649 RepID=A0A2P6RK64_ROSCH|nr:hypothetical protein RchiOBHm_Chr2g0093111 [Rosa chinensis]